MLGLELFSLLAVATALQIPWTAPHSYTPTRWSALGPLPIGTREIPLWTAPGAGLHRSPLVDGGVLAWMPVEATQNGVVEVGDLAIRSAAALPGRAPC